VLFGRIYFLADCYDSNWHLDTNGPRALRHRARCVHPHYGFLLGKDGLKSESTTTLPLTQLFSQSL
jgi:hypothetical protein